VRGEGCTGCGDLAGVGVQVALGGGQRAVPSDLAQDVKGDPGVREPRQPGVAQVVSSKVLKAEGCCLSRAHLRSSLSEVDVFPMTSHMECVAILEPAAKSV
jgi:hypothetical protein